MYFENKKTPQIQTDDEWWNDYDSVEPVNEISPIKQSCGTTSPTYIFRYIGHRTTCKKSVALEFESIDGKITAVMFFNVELSSRNNKPYPAGMNGQFNPRKRSKFRKFYKEVTGEEPDRWCRVHKSLRSKFKGLSFLCSFESHRDGKGEKYFKITEIKIYE